MLNYNKNYPNFIKYMGSKTNILDFIMTGISEVYTDGSKVVDLFAGSATLSGALRGHASVISNDIQVYSKVLAEAYLTSYDWGSNANTIEDIIQEATAKYEELIELNEVDTSEFQYNDSLTVEQFNKIEKAQQKLIEKKNWIGEYYLFAKNYSGTYWNYDQCVWIDAYKYVADHYSNQSLRPAIMAALMFAMSYNAQSTGHYAQYRDANNEKSMKDILIYRQKEITPFVRRKLTELRDAMPHTQDYEFETWALDYRECLRAIPEESTIYADPPYCFVHYSRFYHVLETLIKYDYPEVKYKGRYRTDRHQSPFCIKTQVKDAFTDMFELTRAKNSNLVLSYSNTGMISLDEINELAADILPEYSIQLLTMDYKHSTMGRKFDKFKDVQEALITMKR